MQQRRLEKNRLNKRSCYQIANKQPTWDHSIGTKKEWPANNTRIAEQNISGRRDGRTWKWERYTKCLSVFVNQKIHVIGFLFIEKSFVWWLICTNLWFLLLFSFMNMNYYALIDFCWKKQICIKSSRNMNFNHFYWWAYKLIDKRNL